MTEHKLHFKKISDTQWKEIYKTLDGKVVNEITNNGIITQEKIQEWADQACLRCLIIEITNEFGFNLQCRFSPTPPALPGSVDPAPLVLEQIKS
jgi:hypothetical protein